jgi:6-phosphogluconolactonase
LTLPPDFKGKNWDSEVITDRAGRFLYAANRGHDSIALFTIDAAKGTLRFVETVSSQGNFPRNFNLDPAGAWMLVANQNTDNVAVYKVDRKTGRMTPTGQQIQAPAPTCVKFVPVE